MFKRIILLILIVFTFKGCTKDDICPPDTATTAKVVIAFNDIANPTVSKNVSVLSVETDYETSVDVISFQSTNEIAIPLSTTSDTTKYRFIRTTFRTTDTLTNIDKVMFVYQRQDSYVNRACGFKTEYFNLEADLEDEGIENWIKQVTVIRETVNDENSAHITMLH
ncbi:DUF6452 family protein [Aequorivita antarctica]|uniref:Uncharacterized protein n=1 Tax=Aequorivita antarctica TaxID=153266 RepID=A0A5C6Z4H0_9FLAO|nr:DUF6452 family protein [Aequorivita antarctica]TXD74532.1 hypothetical protein ESU54_04575 [Aequorivita antarctica]SRX73894.1 hypothetical protein AEQU3_01329 [Aequorivita antarctica]